MEYVFSMGSQALLALGKLQYMKTAAGQILPFLIHPDTKKVVEIAKATAGFSMNPLIIPIQLILGVAQMGQNHRGFQAVLSGLNTLTANVVILQSTTAVIGVGTVATVALSAINLQQTLRLRKDIKTLGLDVKDGFIDLKQALRHQGTEVIAQIDCVAQDIKFEQHRLELAKAYGRFQAASRLIQLTLSCDDSNIRNADLANSRQTLSEALGIYRNPHLLSETCAAGQLRRLECAWSMEQVIALTYQLQNQPDAAINCLIQLEDRIRQDAAEVIKHRQSDAELDFLFPELKRIYDTDLVALNIWQNSIDAVRSLPIEELRLLTSSNGSTPEKILDSTSDFVDDKDLIISIPPEQLLYEELKQKSHIPSLDLQLQFLVAPQLRQVHESYIQQQAEKNHQNAMTPCNLMQASDLAIANLYWYFQTQVQ